MVEDIQQAGRLEEEDELLLWCISGWTYAGSFAEFVFSIFLLFLKGVCFCFSICWHRTEEKRCFKKLISSSKVVLVLSSLSLR